MAILPSTLTFLTTYKCTAACPECCFKCTPYNSSPVIDKKDLFGITDQALNSFSSLRLVVFSGGECFLLRKLLYETIAYASGKNLSTRCVTNGYWGKNRNNARKIANILSESGLKEINFSTGDDHQQFVPIQSIINSAIECSLKDVTTLIIVEGYTNSHFKLEDIIENEEISDFIKNNPKAINLKIMQNIWIPFNVNRDIEHPNLLELKNRMKDTVDSGCNQLFNGIVITPDLQLASCCGLTLEYIDELKMGKVENNLYELFKIQENDFMKIWLFTDGPAKILEFVKSINPDLNIDLPLVHPCQTCAFLYNNIKIKQEIIVHHKEVLEDVLFRFNLKKERLYQESTICKESQLVAI